MATRNIVPRATGEGSIGTSAKTWGAVYADDIAITNNITAATFTGNLNGTASGNLPLSGGTMTGAIKYAGANSEEFSLGLSSTTNIDIGWNFANEDGALLALRGNSDGGSGNFELFARNASNSVSLLGKPNGDLKWNSKEIERVNSKGTNWIRFESGLQMCWTIAEMTNSGYTWTFPKAFNARPNVQVTTSNGASYSGTGAARMVSWVGNESATSCKVYSNTEASSNLYKNVFAIGYWK